MATALLYWLCSNLFPNADPAVKIFFAYIGRSKLVVTLPEFMQIEKQIYLQLFDVCFISIKHSNSKSFNI